MSPSPRQCPHIGSYPLGLVIFGHHPPSRRLRIRTLPDEYVPALGSRNILNLTPPAHTRVPWCLSRCRCHFLIAVHKTVFETPLPTTTSPSVEHQERGFSTGFTWFTEGGVPSWRLAVLSPFLLSQILNKTGQSLYATSSVVAAAFFHPRVRIGVGPALLHTLLTKTLPSSSPSRAPRICATNAFIVPKTRRLHLSAAPLVAGRHRIRPHPHRCTHPQSRRS
jgi:hypothetical protein